MAEGAKTVFVPGEIEYEAEQKRRTEGIPISEQIWKDLQKLSEDHQEPLKAN